MEVRDEGSGFDLEACTEDPTTPENLLREDGRGLFLMRRLMDQVERFSDDGNVVRLILHRA
jgi:serine/threonine-protein kinase RsbW